MDTAGARAGEPAPSPQLDRVDPLGIDELLSEAVVEAAHQAVELYGGIGIDLGAYSATALRTGKGRPDRARHPGAAPGTCLGDLVELAC